MIITWKQIIINDIKTHYEVSNYGNVRNIDSGRILKPELCNSGYYRVTIYIKNIPHRRSIHRLVALAFLANPNDLPEVNHKDGNKTNNTLSNLEWCTKSENTMHAYSLGLIKNKCGELSHLAKYPKEYIVKACEYMELGFLTIPEISKITHIESSMLYMIKNRRSWVNISKFYDVENCKCTKCEYSEYQIESVFYLLSENKYSIYDIMDKTGVKTSTIRNILTHRYSKFDYLYDIYDVKNFNGRDHITILDNDIKIDAMKLIDDGYKPKQVSTILSSKYNVNIDCVYKFAKDYKNRKLQRLGKGYL